MLDFFGALVIGLTSVLQFICSFFSGILSVFLLVGQCVNFLFYVVGTLPSVLLVFCVAGISIVIVFQLIGR